MTLEIYNWLMGYLVSVLISFLILAYLERLEGNYIGMWGHGDWVLSFLYSLFCFTTVPITIFSEICLFAERRYPKKYLSGIHDFLTKERSFKKDAE